MNDRIPPGRARKWRLADYILFLFLLIFALVVIFPYLWMVFTSFKPSEEVFTAQMRILPRNWILSNYSEVFLTGSFPRYILNSIIVTLCGLVLELTAAFCGAYAFAKLDFYLKNIVFFLVIGTLMIPPQVLMLPTYLVVCRLGWLNSYAGLVIPRAGAAFGIFLLRQFILTIPKEIEDAARMDGAGTFRQLVSIYLPICIPPLATVAVFSVIGFWNDYYWPLVITTENSMRTLALGIGHFKNLEGMGQWELLMAAATSATVPMIIVYIFARKIIIKNLVSRVSKG